MESLRFATLFVLGQGSVFVGFSVTPQPGNLACIEHPLKGGFDAGTQLRAPANAFGRESDPGLLDDLVGYPLDCAARAANPCATTSDHDPGRTAAFERGRI
jgi:hypothetical protein